MNRLIQLRTITLLPLIAIMISWFALLYKVQAVNPPPGGGYPDGNTAVGTEALLDLTIGQDNTALGFRALTNNTQGSLNTAVGSAALKQNRNGSRNTATGFHALAEGRFGNNNTANGYSALGGESGNGNTAVGTFALQTSTGNNNIALGFAAGSNLTTANDNIEIGNRGIAGDSGTIRIGSTAHTRTFIAGISGAGVTGAAVVVNAGGQLGTAPSSQRFKEGIKPMDKASEALLALNPVTFRYKKEIDPTGTAQFGLVAEDVETVNPELVVRDKEGKPYSVRYDAVNAMLLNEFLKEHKAFVEEQHKVEKLEATVTNLVATVKEQAAQIQKVSAQLEVSKPAQQTVLNNQ